MYKSKNPTIFLELSICFPLFQVAVITIIIKANYGKIEMFWYTLKYEK